jgi:hypothetical protein
LLGLNHAQGRITEVLAERLLSHVINIMFSFKCQLHL